MTTTTTPSDDIALAMLQDGFDPPLDRLIDAERFTHETVAEVLLAAERLGLKLVAADSTEDLPDLSYIGNHEATEKIARSYIAVDGEPLPLTDYMAQEATFAVREIDLGIRRSIETLGRARRDLHDGSFRRESLSASDVEHRLNSARFHAGRLLGMADAIIHAHHVAKRVVEEATTGG